MDADIANPFSLLNNPGNYYPDFQWRVGGRMPAGVAARTQPPWVEAAVANQDFANAAAAEGRTPLGHAAYTLAGITPLGGPIMMFEGLRDENFAKWMLGAAGTLPGAGIAAQWLDNNPQIMQGARALLEREGNAAMQAAFSGGMPLDVALQQGRPSIRRANQLIEGIPPLPGDDVSEMLSDNKRLGGMFVYQGGRGNFTDGLRDEFLRTGEGASVYTPGHYVAGNESVARSYARSRKSEDENRLGLVIDTANSSNPEYATPPPAGFRTGITEPQQRWIAQNSDPQWWLRNHSEGLVETTRRNLESDLGFDQPWQFFRGPEGPPITRQSAARAELERLYDELDNNAGGFVHEFYIPGQHLRQDSWVNMNPYGQSTSIAEMRQITGLNNLYSDINVKGNPERAWQRQQLNEAMDDYMSNNLSAFADGMADWPAQHYVRAMREAGLVGSYHGNQGWRQRLNDQDHWGDNPFLNPQRYNFVLYDPTIAHKIGPGARLSE